jgi:serine/threonine-protein kinase PDIK1L
MKEFEIIAKLAQAHPNVIEILDLLMNWQEVIDTSKDNPTIQHDHKELTINGSPTRGQGKKRAPVGLLGDDVLPFRPGDSEHTAFTRPRYVAIVTRFYPEGDLKRFAMQARSPITEPLLTSWIAQIASLLVYLHDQKPRIVHRDLKPENILLTDGGKRAIVTDFGLAFDNQKTFMTTQAGSMPFVAPECWTKRYNEKVDIWSLGCVMYAVATLRVTGESSRIMFNDVDDPDFERTLRREVLSNGYSEGFFRVMMQMLIKDFSVRPSAVEVLRDIVAHMQAKGFPTEHIVLDVRPKTAAEPTLAAAAAAPPSTSSNSLDKPPLAPARPRKAPAAASDPSAPLLGNSA